MKQVIKIFQSKICIWLLETFVATLFLISGLIHLSGPYFFLESAGRYQILETRQLIYVLPFLVVSQFVLALSLLTRFAPRTSLILSGLLFAIFFVCQVFALSLGVSTNCGCFGSQSEMIGVLSLAKLGLIGSLCFAGGFLMKREAVSFTPPTLGEN